MIKLSMFIKSISFAERNKRKVAQYKEKVQMYMDMDTEEFDMNYINVLSNYEHKKMVLVAIVGALIISIITDIWKHFFDVVEQLVVLLYADSASAEEIAKVSLPITLVVAFLVFFLLAVIILDLSNGMKKLIAEKIFFENLREIKSKRE